MCWFLAWSSSRFLLVVFACCFCLLVLLIVLSRCFFLVVFSPSAEHAGTGMAWAAEIFCHRDLSRIGRACRESACAWRLELTLRVLVRAGAAFAV
jgi:hypothetical protein